MSNLSEQEKKAMNEDEIKFRAYLLILNSEFPTHRKTEAMEELLKINNKQQKELEELKKDKKALVDNYNKVLGSFISKDEIKEKIEEIEKEGTKQYWTENVVKMLRELLEERI